MEHSIHSTIEDFIELESNTSLITNRLNKSVTLVSNRKRKSYKISSDLNVKAVKEKVIADNLRDHFHLYHHGTVPHELTGFTNIIRIAPGLSYDLETESFRYIDDQITDMYWTSDNDDAVESFKSKLSESVSNSDAEAILFSGGIDSLLLALLDKSRRPLFHFNNDPIQKMVATALADELDRPLEIVEPNSFDLNNLQLAKQLRENGLGHYLPWNNGATFSEKTYGKKLISGQHADTLLMVDTFAPGINSHGALWHARMLSSISKRAPYTLKFWGSANNKAGLLNNTVNSYDEHVELSGTAPKNLSPINNQTLQSVVSDQIFSQAEFIKYAKLIKIYRFCVNANRIYNEVERTTGYSRELPYYQPEIRKVLMNYLPGVKDCVNPKHLFYEIAKGCGIDYYRFKRKIVRPIVNSQYLVSRVLEKRKHHHSDVALEHIKWNASELGLNLKDLLADLNIAPSETYSKKDLMIIDRRLNYLQYVS